MKRYLLPSVSVTYGPDKQENRGSIPLTPFKCKLEGEEIILPNFAPSSLCPCKDFKKSISSNTDGMHRWPEHGSITRTSIFNSKVIKVGIKARRISRTVQFRNFGFVYSVSVQKSNRNGKRCPHWRRGKSGSPLPELGTGWSTEWCPSSAAWKWTHHPTAYVKWDLNPHTHLIFWWELSLDRFHLVQGCEESNTFSNNLTIGCIKKRLL